MPEDLAFREVAPSRWDGFERLFEGRGGPKSATIVEAYPVAPDSHSYMFMGFVPVSEAAGFRQAGRAGPRRHVMRLEVS